MNRALFPWLLALAIASGLWRAPSAAAENAVSEIVIRGPYLQMVTRSSAVIVWRTQGSTAPLVRYGLALDSLDREVRVEEMTIRVSPEQEVPAEIPRLAAAPASSFQYEAHLTGLTEETTYYYGVFDGDELLAGCSEDYRFRTQPPPDTDRPLRFWVVGDSGDGSEVQKDGFEAMQRFVENDGRPLDAYLHLGDMAYNSGLDHEFQANFFEIYAPLLRNTVVWPTMGNHEGYFSNGVTGVGPYYDAYVVPTEGEAGGVPSGYEGFYSFDLGPIHFVCLNSHDEERSAVGRMTSWLKEDLAQNDSEWLIAFWHHPPYTKGSHNSDTEDQLIEMREIMMPILEDHGVDLVLAGHSHVYERSMLLDGAYATPTTAEGVVLDDGDGRPDGDGPYRKSARLHPHEGTVAVVAGHGRKASRFGLSPVHRVSIVEPGSVILDLEDDTVTVRMLNSRGDVRDEFQLIKRGEVAPRSPVEFPWSPSGPVLLTASREPGATEIHLIPRPDADDAVIHYTLDGSTPTTASPVYTGPVSIRERATVRAFTIWRGGARRSPVSSATTVDPPAPTLSPTVRIPIVASEDDAFETDLGIVDLTDWWVGVEAAESTSLFGIRFRDIPIPPGATILAAAIQFTPGLSRGQPADWTIETDLTTPSPPFTPEIGHLSSRPRGPLSVAWAPDAWLSVVLQQKFTPDLTAMLEEVVHRPDWQRGSSMSFFVSGTGDRVARSFDNVPFRAPVLHVAYSEEDPIALAAGVSPVVESLTATDGTDRVYVSFPQLLSASRRGLLYLIEGSPDLRAGSWEPVLSDVAGILPSPGPGWGVARYRLARPGGLPFGDHYFVRVRVVAQ